MQLYELLLVSVMVAIFMVAGMGEGQADSIFRKPVPAGVVEITGISAGGGIVELKDGSLMLAQGSSYRLSADGGLTWGESQPLNAPFGAEGLIRLQSGGLAIYGAKGDSRYFSSSLDEGKTWDEPSVICPTSAARPVFHSMIQLKLGPLPDAWAFFHYANIYVVGNKVFIRYSRGSALLGVAEQNLNKQESVMRIYPLEYV